MRAVILQHETHEGLGVLERLLTEAGFSLLKRFRSVEHDDVHADLLVVLGGTMGVYEADRHPFLQQEVSVIAERLVHQLPCLGICLGAQLIARAAGAEVFLGKNGFEVGAKPVRWTREGLEDPVIGGVTAQTVVGHWHQDTYGPVPGAVLLASSDRYTQQAFRLGNSYGFQFHAELTAEEYGQWLESSGHAALKPGVSRLRGAEPQLLALLQRLVQHFVSAVSG